VTVVLSLTEATRHPHNVARGTFVEMDGVTQQVRAALFPDAGIDRQRAGEPVPGPARPSHPGALTPAGGAPCRAGALQLR